MFIPAKRNSSGVLGRQGGVGTGHTRIPWYGTASWNGGDVHPGDRGVHIGKKHTFTASHNGTRGLESTKGCKKMRTFKRLKKRTIYVWKAGRVPLQNQGAGCGAAALM